MNYYKQVFEQLGIKEGQVILLSSDMLKVMIARRRLSMAPLDMNELLNALIELIGPDGTLLLPTYNWDFCHGVTFDYYKTQGMTGSLGNVALKRSDFKRTQHPIYSFAVWGKDQRLLCAMNNTSSFAKDSPFGYLDRKEAVNLCIGVPMGECFTYKHYVEQMSGCAPFRYEKEFTAGYVDENGDESVRTYSMFVRVLDMDVQSKSQTMVEILTKKGIVHNHCIDDVNYTLANLYLTTQPMLDDLLYNRGRNLCSYKGQENE